MATPTPPTSEAAAASAAAAAAAAVPPPAPPSTEALKQEVLPIVLGPDPEQEEIDSVEDGVAEVKRLRRLLRWVLLGKAAAVSEGVEPGGHTGDPGPPLSGKDAAEQRVTAVLDAVGRVHAHLLGRQDCNGHRTLRQPSSSSSSSSATTTAATNSTAGGGGGTQSVLDGAEASGDVGGGSGGDSGAAAGSSQGPWTLAQRQDALRWQQWQREDDLLRAPAKVASQHAEGSRRSGSRRRRRERAVRLRESPYVVPHHVVGTAHLKYKVVRRAARALGWDLTADEASGQWTIRWSDYDSDEMFSKQLTQGQAYNHFPLGGELTTKCALVANLNTFQVRFPDEYNFHPKSWVLPSEHQKLKFYWDARKGNRDRRPSPPGRARDRTTRRGGRSAKASSGEDSKKDVPLKECLICKPNVSSRGRGIYLTADVPELDHETGKMVVQLYIPRPLLINSIKFDLRLYVLMTSVTPQLRVFLHREGLARLATMPYEEPNATNLADDYRHLTNYSVNKMNKEKFVAAGTAASSEAAGGAGGKEGGGGGGGGLDATIKRYTWGSRHDDRAATKAEKGGEAGDDEAGEVDGKKASRVGLHRIEGGSYLAGGGEGLREPLEDARVRYARGGSKWTVTALIAWFHENGYDKEATDALWQRIEDLVCKTCLCVREKLAHGYNAATMDDGFSCFEIFGFDVLLNADLKPFILEVNQSPMLQTDSRLDELVKSGVVQEALQLVAVTPESLLEADVSTGLTPPPSPSPVNSDADASADAEVSSDQGLTVMGPPSSRGSSRASHKTRSNNGSSSSPQSRFEQLKGPNGDHGNNASVMKGPSRDSAGKTLNGFASPSRSSKSVMWRWRKQQDPEQLARRQRILTARRKEFEDSVLHGYNRILPEALEAGHFANVAAHKSSFTAESDRAAQARNDAKAARELREARQENDRQRKAADAARQARLRSLLQSGALKAKYSDTKSRFSSQSDEWKEKQEAARRARDERRRKAEEEAKRRQSGRALSVASLDIGLSLGGGLGIGIGSAPGAGAPAAAAGSAGPKASSRQGRGGSKASAYTRARNMDRMYNGGRQ